MEITFFFHTDHEGEFKKKKLMETTVHHCDFSSLSSAVIAALALCIVSIIYQITLIISELVSSWCTFPMR